MIGKPRQARRRTRELSDAELFGAHVPLLTFDERVRRERLIARRKPTKRRRVG